jgi:DnaK suppressor protein
MKTIILTKFRQQLLQRLAEVETATANIAKKMSESTETRTNMGKDNLDHSREQSDSYPLFEMKKRYSIERQKILSALGRIENGSFGECIDCGEPIAVKRLLVQPSASLCVECQHSMETYREADIIFLQKTSNNCKEVV